MSQVSIIQDEMLLNYLRILSSVVLYYDHVLTFPDEVRYIWLRPKLLPSSTFILNRYFSFVYNLIYEVINPIIHSQKSCGDFSLVHQLSLVASQILVAVLLILRVYALYNRNLRVLLLLAVTAVALTGVACWSVVGHPGTIVTSSYGCNTAPSKTVGYFFATSWEAQFILDTFVFVLTVARSFKARRQFNFKMGSVTIPLQSVLLRDGAIYFAAIGLANFSNILTFYFAPPLLKGSLSMFASSVSVTMMSRLMLNLHETAEGGIMTLGTITDLAFMSRFSPDGQDIALEDIHASRSP